MTRKRWLAVITLVIVLALLVLPRAAGAQRFPDIGIPCPVDPTACFDDGVPFPDVNPVDDAAEAIGDAIWGWLNDQLKDLYNKLYAEFERYIYDPPKPADKDAVDYAYGNALGLAGMLSIAIAFMVTLVAIAWQKLFRAALYSWWYLVLIFGLGPLFYLATEKLAALTHDLAQVAMFYEPPSGNQNLLSSVPDVVNVLGSLIGLAWLGSSGLTLVLIIIAYQMLIIATTFMALPLFALSSAGGIFQKLLAWNMAIWATALSGIVVASAWLTMGQWMQGQIPEDSTAARIFFMVVAIILAIVFQIVLLISFYSVSNKVVGRVVATTWRGKTDANVTHYHQHRAGQRGHQRAQHASQFYGRIDGADEDRHTNGSGSRRDTAIAVASAADPRVAAAVQAVETVKGRRESRDRPAPVEGGTDLSPSDARGDRQPIEPVDRASDDRPDSAGNDSARGGE